MADITNFKKSHFNIESTYIDRDLNGQPPAYKSRATSVN